MKIERSVSFFLRFASFACLLGYSTIAYLSRQTNSVDLLFFLTVSLVCAVLSFLVVWQYQGRQQEIPFFWILASAIIFRVTGIIGDPFLEDDFYRYLWDGYRMAETGDPYSLAPSWYFASNDIPQQFEQILSAINYPDIATVYGPLSQWVFAAAYQLAPGAVWPLQMVTALSDIGVLLILRSISRSNLLLLYAWCPLLIKEFAFTAHPDALAIFLAMAAFRSQLSGRAAITGTCLALATGVKVFALLLLPFLLLYNKRWQQSLITLLCYLLTMALFSWQFGTLEIWYPQGLRAMAESWLFNSPFYYWLTPVFGFPAIKLIFLVGFSVLFSRYFVVTQRTQSDFPADFRASIRIRGDWIYGIFLLCSPVINPWYFAWVLPFAVLYPTRWAWTASVTLLLSYATATNLVNSGGMEPALDLYSLSPGLLSVEFGLIAFAYLWDWYRPLVREPTTG